MQVSLEAINSLLPLSYLFMVFIKSNLNSSRNNLENKLKNKRHFRVPLLAAFHGISSHPSHQLACFHHIFLSAVHIQLSCQLYINICTKPNCCLRTPLPCKMKLFIIGRMALNKHCFNFSFLHTFTSPSPRPHHLGSANVLNANNKDRMSCHFLLPHCFPCCCSG